MTAATSDKIFIVHGRDEATRQAVARLLSGLGKEPVVLQDLASGGRTVIEKFEHYAKDARYAIVLLTPDDIGGLQALEERSTRARQNVIFELGFFIGRLGRGKVCLLSTPDVELPSDLHGVVYIPIDAESQWGWALVHEFLQAEISLDPGAVARSIKALIAESRPRVAAARRRTPRLRPLIQPDPLPGGGQESEPVAPVDSAYRRIWELCASAARENDDIYVEPAIPPRVLKNARSRFLKSQDPVIAFVDNSYGGKDGLAILTTGLCWRNNYREPPHTLTWPEMKDCPVKVSNVEDAIHLGRDLSIDLSGSHAEIKVVARLIRAIVSAVL